MFYNLLSAGKLALGLESTLIGAVVVFTVLGLLVFSVKLMEWSNTKKKANALPEAKQQPVLKTETAQLPAPQSDNNAAVVAAITAAITMTLEQQGRSNVRFVVRKISQIK